MKLSKELKQELVDILEKYGIITSKDTCGLSMKISEGSLLWINKEVNYK